MSARRPFPWHYYIRSVRTRIFFILLACILTYGAIELYPETFFGKEAIVFGFLCALVLIHSYFRVAPMRHILSRMEALQDQMSHGKKLNLIYQKNEFEIIEEMLSLMEGQLRRQKESYENQLIQSDTILEYIPNAVVIVDKFKNCKQYNLQFEKKFIQGKDVHGVTQAKLWKVFDREEDLLSAFDQALVSKNKFEKNRSNIHGKYFSSVNEYFDIAITPVFDSKDRLSGALGIFHNVTQSKLNEKMRVDFVANVSHEIRTPLTSIKGYSQLLQAHKSKIPENLHGILEKINSNTERLKELFDNLLKLSVIESKREVKKEAFDLAELVALIRSNLKGKYLNKNFEVKVSGDASVYGDRKLLEQVFTNLVDNAIKYSDKGDILIEIESRDGGESNEIVVKDNGPGFSSAEQERIFERFYRIQGQSLHPVEGSGLGLSIVKHILNIHSGSIKASSSEGEGSTFTICLPKIAGC